MNSSHCLRWYLSFPTIVVLLSFADTVAKAIQSHLAANGGNVQHEGRVFLKGSCPDCGGIVEHGGGCAVCRTRGYSECV